MTFLMTCIVIYLYTVIAFNFFRKFYVHKVDDDFKIMKCQSMFQVNTELFDVLFIAIVKYWESPVLLFCKVNGGYKHLFVLVFPLPH